MSNSFLYIFIVSENDSKMVFCEYDCEYQKDFDVERLGYGDYYRVFGRFWMVRFQFIRYSNIEKYIIKY